MGEGRLVIRVRVKPGSRVSQLAQEADGTWLAHLKSRPVDGKANAELIELVAERFNCRKADVVLKSGASSRVKLISVGVP
jgi:uncharacterized protein (TIGR00251 family)